MLLAAGRYDDSINRAYYAVFYAALALLLSQGIRRSKHSGVLAAFRQFFVRTGIIETEYSDIYGAVMDARELSDYDLQFTPASGYAETLVADAERFVARMVRYLRQVGAIE